MKIYLAGAGWGKRKWMTNIGFDFFRLESYYHISNKERAIINKYKSFMLDSGAFSFMKSNKKNINWQDYVEEYAQFIIKYNVDLFFELDIDPIVGLKEVERLRFILEKTAGRKCIPVWHKSRGLDYWKMMCNSYNYVAIGGIVTREIKNSEYRIFNPLLKIARENNCKVHGLGFTNLKGLEKYKFDSVDSTSWLSGNRFGAVYKFNGKTMIKHVKPKGFRVRPQITVENNFYEWVKFQKYAEKNL